MVMFVSKSERPWMNKILEDSFKQLHYCSLLGYLL